MPDRCPAKNTWWRLALPLVGGAAFLLFWQVAVVLLADSVPMAAYFSPQKALTGGWRLLISGEIAQHTIDSLRRVFVGLALAICLGVPIGLLVGLSRLFEDTTHLLFQFLRMVSPLSWMPLAVIVLGVGDAPVYFLLAFAGVWPIVINVAAGVKAIDPKWLRLAQSFSATRLETLWRIILPAILDHLLTGVRLAVGVLWIVLVPAEMLGVRAGLGYFILDCRDRMEYGELVAAIFFIGAIGALLDYAARRIRLGLRKG